MLPPSNAFNEVEVTTLDLDGYINLRFENVLNPGSVTANSFAVTDARNNADIVVTDAVLEPLANTVTLYVTAEELSTLDCSVVLVRGDGFGLRYINSSEEVTLADASCELTPVYKGGLYDLSVMGMKMYDLSGGSIVAPVSGSPFKVKVSVVNGTGIELTRTLILYKNTTASDAIATQIINLNAYTAGEFTFDISAMEWAETDKIIAVIN